MNHKDHEHLTHLHLDETPALHFRVFRSTSGAVRVLFTSPQVVVKLFDPKQGETYSIKLWRGDVTRVVSDWNMVETVCPRLSIAEARVVSIALADVASIGHDCAALALGLRAATRAKLTDDCEAGS